MGYKNLRVFFSFNYNLLSHLSKNKNKNFATVCYHHYFTHNNINNIDLEVSFDTLDKQLKFFKDNYSVVESNHYLENLYYDYNNQNNTSTKPSIILCVDDADESFYRAIKYYEKYNLPVTLFVPVGLCLEENNIDRLRSNCFEIFSQINHDTESYDFPNEYDSFFDYVLQLKHSECHSLYKELKSLKTNPFSLTKRQLLTYSQLSEISKHPLITIASHSMSHQNFHNLGFKFANWEIQKSIKYISEIGGNSKLFAYPYGHKNSYDHLSEYLLLKNNVKFAFTTKSSIINNNSNPLQLGRVTLMNTKNRGYLNGLIKGSFYWWDKILNRL